MTDHEHEHNHDDETTAPDFSVLTQGMFGPVEQTVGTDQYNANVENTRSMTEGNKVLADLMRARVEQRKAVATAIYVVLIMSIPVYVVLLVWMIKTLVV